MSDKVPSAGKNDRSPRDTCDLSVGGGSGTGGTGTADASASSSLEGSAEAIEAARRAGQEPYEKLVATYEKRIDELKQEIEKGKADLKEETKKRKKQKSELKEQKTKLEEKIKKLEEQIKKPDYPIGGTEAVGRREDRITPELAERSEKVEERHREAEDKASKAERSLKEKDELMNKKVRELEERNKELEERSKEAEKVLKETRDRFNKRLSEQMELVQNVRDEQEALRAKRNEADAAEAARIVAAEGEHDQEIKTQMAAVNTQQHWYSVRIEELEAEIKYLNSKLDSPKSSHGNSSGMGTHSAKQKLHNTLEQRVKEWVEQSEACQGCSDSLESAEKNHQKKQTKFWKDKVDTERQAHKDAKRILVESSRELRKCLLALVKASGEPDPDLAPLTPFPSAGTGGGSDSGYGSDDSFCWTCGEQWG